MLFPLALGIIGLITDGANGERSSNMIEGTLANFGEFKYVVSIMEYPSPEARGTQICGGAIISKRHVLTAAHCFDNNLLYSILSGTFNPLDDRNSSNTRISNIILRPDYKSARTNPEVANDLAVVVLYEELPFNERWEQVNLPNFQVGPGTQAIIAAWGMRGRDGAEPANPYKLEMTLWSNEMWPVAKCTPKPGTLCAYSTADTTTCMYDSGSPLVYEGYLVGIVSSGYCIGGSFTTYVNVYHYRDWVQNVMADSVAIGERSGKIIGGSLATFGEFRYMVAIMEYPSIGARGYQICGGAIISNRHVLTAAHCFDKNLSWAVLSGTIDLLDVNQGRINLISRIIKRPDYKLGLNHATQQNDLAVVVLADELPIGGQWELVKLPNFQVAPGSHAIIAGWGMRGNDQAQSPILYKIQVTFSRNEVWSIEQCMPNPGTICAYSTADTATCWGDSGSPLVSNQYLIGIDSGGNCLPGSVTIYTNVYFYRDWIQNVINRI